MKELIKQLLEGADNPGKRIAEEPGKEAGICNKRELRCLRKVGIDRDLKINRG